MANENDSAVKTNSKIFNELFCGNTEFQHVQDVSCSKKELDETCEYQDYCDEIDIKEELENNMSLHLQHADDKHMNSIGTMHTNFHNQEDILVTEEEKEVNDISDSSWHFVHVDCKVEINEELENSSNAESSDLTETEKDGKSNVCDNIRFTERQELKNYHTNEQHGICGACDKVFAHSSIVDEHKRSHTCGMYHGCKVCNETFTNAHNFLQHQRAHIAKKAHICDVCSKPFSRFQDLRAHKRTHTGEKPYVCDVCNRAFAQHSTLTGHKRTHTGEKPYVCGECGKAFGQSQHLTKHKRTHIGVNL